MKTRFKDFSNESKLGRTASFDNTTNDSPQNSYSQNKNNGQNHESYINQQLKFMNFEIHVKTQMTTFMKTMGIKAAAKLNIFLQKSNIMHLQELLELVKDKSALSLVERVDNLQVEEISNLVSDIFNKSINDYKKFVDILKNNKDYLEEIVDDKNFKQAIVQENKVSKSEYYRILKKQLTDFIRYLNHLIYSNLKSKGIFNKNQGKLLKFLLRFFEIVEKTIQNEGNLLKTVSEIENFEFQSDVTKDYYCFVLRKRIFEEEI